MIRVGFRIPQNIKSRSTFSVGSSLTMFTFTHRDEVLRWCTWVFSSMLHSENNNWYKLHWYRSAPWSEFIQTISTCRLVPKALTHTTVAFSMTPCILSEQLLASAMSLIGWLKRVFACTSLFQYNQNTFAGEKVQKQRQTELLVLQLFVLDDGLWIRSLWCCLCFNSQFANECLS